WQRERQRGPAQAELGHEEDRAEHGGDQRPEVVERQHPRDEFLEVELVLQNSHQEREFEADQHTDQEHGAEEEYLEVSEPAEREEQQRTGQPTDQRDPDLDLDERPGQPLLDEPGEPRPDPEGRQVDADDERELGDRVAQDVAGQRSREQLVDEPAGGDHQDVQEQDRGAVHGEDRNPGLKTGATRQSSISQVGGP